MMTIRKCTVLVATVLVACNGLVSQDTDRRGAGLTNDRPNARPPNDAGVIGDPLAGLSSDELARFEAGKAAFAEVEDVADGLGPVFNGTSCGGCHDTPMIGGGSTTMETRFGRTVNGVFDPLTELGGSLIQVQGIGIVDGCDFVGEVVPATANVRAERLTTPLFGLGLVDAVPDATLVTLAAAEGQRNPATAGRAARVVDAATGRPAIGRFGWKAQVPTILHFSADAYLNEMGITNPLFRNEQCPQGDCTLLRCDPVPDPEDDGTDIRAFTDFITLLAPPPQGRIDPAGANAFDRIGCSDCHTPRLVTGPSSISALDRKTLSPFSDFLLHDMGTLADGIAQADAKPAEMRTAPLWGARFRTRFLHDGRAATLNDAILAHDGQGADARDAFVALPAAQQAHVLAFIGSL